MQKFSKEMQKLLESMAAISYSSKTNKKLTEYISKNYMKIIFMTAGQLAAAVGISQGSVTRFCISLNFRGYNDFLRKFQEYVGKQITLPQRLEYTSNADADLSNIFNAERKNIDSVEALLKEASYKRMKNKIAGAGEVVLLSARMSATLLPYTFYLLNNIRNGIHQVTPNMPAWDTLGFMDKKNTLIVAFVFPRYSNLLMTKLEELKTAGFEIEVITDVGFPYLESLEYNHISIPTTVSSIFDIYSTPILFINLLIRDLAKEIKDLPQRMEALEELEQKNNIYYKL